MKNDASREAVASPRIGRGIPAFVLGFVLICLGVFGLVAASGGGQGAGLFGISCLVAGGGMIAVGFWISLFSKLELRLIDIQNSVVAAVGEQRRRDDLLQPPQETPPKAMGDPETDDALMARYGITAEGGKYHYKTYRYDLLRDAVRYARAQSS